MEMQLNVARYYSHENKHIYSEPTVRNIFFDLWTQLSSSLSFASSKNCYNNILIFERRDVQNDCFALIFASFFLAFEGLNISLYISVFDKSKRSRLER